MFPPSRIVCLTEDAVETLYLLGEQDRIVGISGYVVRPPQARCEKRRVSAFTSANVDNILTLKPDLVLTLSDLQAGSSRACMRYPPNLISCSHSEPSGGSSTSMEGCGLTDWTLAVTLLTYEQAVEAFRVTDRLSDSDRADLMAETPARAYNWSPSNA